MEHVDNEKVLRMLEKDDSCIWSYCNIETYIQHFDGITTKNHCGFYKISSMDEIVKERIISVEIYNNVICLIIESTKDDEHYTYYFIKTERILNKIFEVVEDSKIYRSNYDRNPMDWND